MEYAIDAAIASKELRLKSIAASAGYMCDAPRAEFYNYIDAANIDLKAFTQSLPWPFAKCFRYLKLFT